jgi:hypothetical protein
MGGVASTVVDLFAGIVELSMRLDRIAGVSDDQSPDADANNQPPHHRYEESNLSGCPGRHEGACSAHTFLTSEQVFARYGKRRTAGYHLLHSERFPNRVAGKYRLDTLLAWEEENLHPQEQDADSRGRDTGMEDSDPDLTGEVPAEGDPTAPAQASPDSAVTPGEQRSSLPPRRRSRGRKRGDR